MMSLDALERAEQAEGFGRIRHGETSGEAMLSLENLSVSLDDGTAVVDETEDIIEPGERLLVAGESGSGKGTPVRAIAGPWPWGGGSVNFHRPPLVHAAAAALRAVRHAAARGRLSRLGRQLG
jgi:putative ATP-binding cassette transporter